MLRRERSVALIQCNADENLIAEIAMSCGLLARSASSPGHFYLINSGRNLASEMGPPLLAATVRALDEAAERGEIPTWTVIEDHLAAASNSE
jgi:hypothetical protein